MANSPAADIVKSLGGADNIDSMTHCATRLRFQLVDGSKVNNDEVEAIDGVMGAVPQAGDRYQVIIGGGVQTVFNEIQKLPEMSKGGGGGGSSDADVKAAARSQGPRGKFAWLDNFFEYLSDSFRPILGVLLGASLIIAFAAVLDALKIVDFRAAEKDASWVFVDAMWRGVFYFIPIMVAYNAAKKLDIDPWVGGAVMGAVMTPNFLMLSSAEYLQKNGQVVCTKSDLGTQCVARVFGLPMQLPDYGGQVFVPLIMVAVLGLVYHFLKRLIPENVQLVFVPFLSMAIMIPLTAFLIGPLGVWLGLGIGNGLGWLNSVAPWLFAILIPLLYPFLVPLGLHWPLNAIMLANINNNGYDFIQGPMGAWNFACFGATAGVLFLSIRDKDVQMRQTATGALAAGLLGGISEPSLYGIHLRFKRIYPRMLIGCGVGGLVIGIGSFIFPGTQWNHNGTMSAAIPGVTTNAFAFTSLLTIPVFKPIVLYVIAILAAFVTAMMMVIISDYRTPEQKAEAAAKNATAEPVASEAPKAAVAAAAAAPKAPKPAMVPGTVTEIPAPLAGRCMPLAEVPDAAFAKGAVGPGVGIDPSENKVYAPTDCKVMVAHKTGHAFGLQLDSGVEILIHIGIDTVNLDGKGFDVKVKTGDQLKAGDELVTFDRGVIEAAGYSLVTPVLVMNHKRFGSVEGEGYGDVSVGTPVVKVTAKTPVTEPAKA